MSDTMQFGITIRAEGEVRKADGTLREQVAVEEVTEVVEVNIDELREAVERRNLTDDQLREIGLDENTINIIRSKE